MSRYENPDHKMSISPTRTNSSTLAAKHKEGVNSRERKGFQSQSWQLPIPSVGSHSLWKSVASVSQLESGNSGIHSHHVHPRPVQLRAHDSTKLGKHFLTTMSDRAALCCSTGFRFPYINEKVGVGSFSWVSVFHVNCAAAARTQDSQEKSYFMLEQCASEFGSKTSK